MFRGVMRSSLALALVGAACSSGHQFSQHDAGNAGAPSAGAVGHAGTGGKATDGSGGTAEQAGDTALGSGGESDGGAPANGATGGANNGGTGARGGGSSSGGDTSMDGGAANAAGTAVGGNGANGGSVAAGGASGGASSGAGAASGGRVGSGGRGAAGDAAIAGAGTGGQAAIGGCDQQQLANANFEAGPGAPWQELSEWPGIEIISANEDPKLQAQGVAAYGGHYLAWLGGVPDDMYDSHNVTLSQSVTIPDGTSTLTLTGEYRVKSDEPTDAVYDEAYVQLEDTDTVYWVALQLSNEDQGDSWQTFSVNTTDLDAIRGKTLNFVAYSRTDPMVPTSFFLDDLVLTATCGR